MNTNTYTVIGVYTASDDVVFHVCRAESPRDAAHSFFNDPDTREARRDKAKIVSIVPGILVDVLQQFYSDDSLLSHETLLSLT